MRILFISQNLPYVPCTDGFRLIAFNLLRHLSRGHQIHLISFLGSERELEHIDQLRRYCVSVQTVLEAPSRSFVDSASRMLSHPLSIISNRLLPEMQAKIAQALARLEIEIVHVEGLAMGRYVSKDLSIPKIISIHDAQSLRVQQYIQQNKNPFLKLKHTLNWMKVRRLELEVLTKFDWCVVVSSNDKEFIKSFLPGMNVSVAANGVDCDYFRPYRLLADCRKIILSGNMSYPPNVDAALYFYNNIFPLIRCEMPKVELLVVGAYPTKEIEELAVDHQVTVTGFVKDIRPYFYGSCVCVCPLRIGTGIKNKILEAMAMGVPIVATSLSTSGIDVSPQEHIIIADEVVEFAKKAIDLMQNRELRLHIARKARRFVETNHSWEATAHEFERVYSRAITHRFR